jgi:dipeptidyl aminopeptidase/acylaminoacyl peptidase
LNNNEIVITYTKNATNGLLIHNIAKSSTIELDLGLIDIQRCAIQRVSDTQFVVIAGTAIAPIALYLVDVTRPKEKKFLKSTANIELDTALVSKVLPITFPRTHGQDQTGSAHAMFISPHNPDFTAPPGTMPPLIVNIHGGPTSHVGPGLSLPAQYYTSRGYAYCYVNHAGSTGYGRQYREDLDYSWGIKDCEDTISCIEYLTAQGLIDPSKVGITGGSAGGYTTFQAMVTFPKIFASGCSLYGIGNLKSLAQETHKFESYYLFALLYPDNTPEEEKENIYKERSPCFHVERIERPLVILQGDNDNVVPMGQAVEMERIMREAGKDVKLVVFEGEGHGFVMQEHVKRAIEEEEALWKRTLL